ncbi:TPA: RHS repeat protein, partial [Citrobacter farmeri]|nr:RHS repeat protein [Citrobacter farmeri]HCA0594966.1 RHS repeat protein [Citrobacter farmeri]
QRDRFGRTLVLSRAQEGEFAGHITGVTDGSGRHYRLELNQAVAATESDSGVRLAAVWLEYDNGETIPEQPLARYGYSGRGELVSVSDRSGMEVRAFAYHPGRPGLMAGQRHTGRPATAYDYDDAGRAVRQLTEGGQGLDYHFDYQPDKTLVTWSDGRQRTYHTEGEGGLKRVVRTDHPDGSSEQKKYDASGRLTATTDPLGRKTTYAPDVVSGAVSSIKGPDGKETRFDYNRQGQLIATLYPDGSVTRNGYDALGRITAQTAADGSITRYRYAGVTDDLPVEIEDASGGRKQLQWDRYGQLISYTDCSGYKTTYTYDPWGNLTEIRGEEGSHLTHEYDARGNRVSSTDAEGRTTRYRHNRAGDLIAVIFPDGSEQHLTRDKRGHLTETRQGALVREYHYDPAGRLTGLTNENRRPYRFSYDEMDRLTEEVAFDGRTQRWRYDVAGQLILRQDGDITHHYQYDDAGQLIRLHSTGAQGDTRTQHYRYTDAGQTAEVRDDTSGIRWRYDAGGRIAEEVQTAYNADGEAIWQHKARHHYDALGNEHQTQYGALPQTGWQRYGSGHLIGAGLGGHVRVELTRDKRHREAERVFGCHSEQRRYTAAGQLAARVTGSESQDYRYDTRGQLTGAGAERQYGYDEHGRLISAVQSGLSAAYHYDPAGNRVEGEGQQQFDNRPAQDSRWQYEYDAWGNLIKKSNEREKHLYTYDLLHRLTGFEKQTPDGAVTKATYHYDPSGRRISKTVRRHHQSDTTRYGWDGDRLVMTEKSGHKVYTLYEPNTFTPLLRIESDGGDEPYTPLADKLRQHSQIPFTAQEYADMERLEDDLRTGKLSERSRGWLEFANIPANLMAAQLDPLPVVNIRNIHLYQCDHRGMPVALINREGQADWRAESDPWGEILSEDNPHNIEQPLRLPGQWYDEESGLHYNRHRYYDPQQGRYITQDPIGLKGGLNTYAYAPNPISWIDPLGFTSIIIGNGPVPDNPFGHAALATTRNGVISFGTGDSLGTTSLNSYFSKMQPRRDSWVWVVDTTSEEEECMFNKAKEMGKNQGLFFDNCYSRTNAIFEACGFTNPHMNTNSPASLQVLGGLYGTQHIMIPKGDFLGLPPELNGLNGGGK